MSRNSTGIPVRRELPVRSVVRPVYVRAHRVEGRQAHETEHAPDNPWAYQSGPIIVQSLPQKVTLVGVSAMIPELLARLHAEDQTAFNDLVTALYGELHRVPSRHLRGERAGHTLRTTALVHEVYLKLAGDRDSGFHDRVHFLSVASRALDHRHSTGSKNAKRTSGTAGSRCCSGSARQRGPIPRGADRNALLRRDDRGGNGRGAWQVGPHRAASFTLGPRLAIS